MPRSAAVSTLLDDLTRDSVDAGYAQAAARRAADPTSAGSRRSRPTRLPGGAAAAGLVVAGLLLASAVVQVRAGAPENARVRSSLTAEVADRTRSTDALAARVAGLRADVSAARLRTLAATRSGAETATTVAALEAAIGATPQVGPGLQVTLDDAVAPVPDPLAATPGPKAPVPEVGRITDRDVQDVVNALWAAGAEAIAVGGQRLSAQAAIRSAGQAILVDFRPLSPPYTIDALGNRDTLGSQFGDSATARRFRTYATAYGVRFAVRSAKALTVPAAPGAPLRSARALEVGR